MRWRVRNRVEVLGETLWKPVGTCRAVGLPEERPAGNW